MTGSFLLTFGQFDPVFTPRVEEQSLHFIEQCFQFDLVIDTFDTEAVVDVFSGVLTMHEMTVHAGPYGSTVPGDDLLSSNLFVITGIERTIAERTVLTVIVAWVVVTTSVATDPSSADLGPDYLGEVLLSHDVRIGLYALMVMLTRSAVR